MEISNLLTILCQASWKSFIAMIQGISSATHDSHLLTILCQASWFASIGLRKVVKPCMGLTPVLYQKVKEVDYVIKGEPATEGRVNDGNN